MFRVDIAAIHEAAIEARLVANQAKAAGPEKEVAHPLATLAVSHQSDTYTDPAVAELLEAAMRVCDAWDDGPDAREQMRQDVLATPPYLRVELLEHLDGSARTTAANCRGCERNGPSY